MERVLKLNEKSVILQKWETSVLSRQQIGAENMKNEQMSILTILTFLPYQKGKTPC